MRIIVNGREVETSPRPTVVEFLEGRGIDPRTVIVEHNRAVLPPGEWTGVHLSEGDEIEVMRFVGGG